MRTRTLRCSTSPLTCSATATAPATPIWWTPLPSIWRQKGEYDPSGENRFKPGICNRLDRGTEGLVHRRQELRRPAGHERDHPHRPAQKGVLHHHGGASPSSGRFTAWCEHRREEQQGAASTPTSHRTSAASRSSPTWMCCGTAGPFALCRIGLITGPHPPDPCPSGLSGQAGAGRHQVRQPEDERAHRRQNAGPLRRRVSASSTSRRKTPCTTSPAKSSN